MKEKHSDIEMANMILDSDKCQYSAEDAYVALIRLREKKNRESSDTMANIRKVQAAAADKPAEAAPVVASRQYATERQQNKCAAQVTVFQSNSFTNLLLGIIIALMLLNMFIKD